MARLTSINANGSEQDTVIEAYMSPVKIDGKISYTDEMAGTAIHKGMIYEIRMYLKKGNNSKDVELIKLSAVSIKKLYKEILELEALEADMVVEH